MKLIQEQEKWLVALESGQFEQGVGALCRVASGADGPVRRYCCLGVAEMALGTETTGPVFLDFGQVLGFLQRERGSVVEMTKTVLTHNSVARLGLNSIVGSVHRRFKREFDSMLLQHAPDLLWSALNKATCLTDYNDQVRAPFKALAATIRTVPEAVFRPC